MIEPVKPYRIRRIYEHPSLRKREPLATPYERLKERWRRTVETAYAFLEQTPDDIAPAINMSRQIVVEIIEEYEAAVRAEAEARRLAALPDRRKATITVESNATKHNDGNEGHSRSRAA